LAWYEEPGNGERVRAQLVRANRRLEELPLDDFLDLITDTLLTPMGGGFVDMSKVIEELFKDTPWSGGAASSEKDQAHRELMEMRARRRSRVDELRKAQDLSRAEDA
jgi:hypothetical protein